MKLIVIYKKWVLETINLNKMFKRNICKKCNSKIEGSYFMLEGFNLKFWVCYQCEHLLNRSFNVVKIDMPGNDDNQQKFSFVDPLE